MTRMDTGIIGLCRSDGRLGQRFQKTRLTISAANSFQPDTQNAPFPRKQRRKRARREVAGQKARMPDAGQGASGGGFVTPGRQSRM